MHLPGRIFPNCGIAYSQPNGDAFPSRAGPFGRNSPRFSRLWFVLVLWRAGVRFSRINPGSTGDGFGQNLASEPPSLYPACIVRESGRDWIPIAGSHHGSGRSRLVSPQPLGMENEHSHHCRASPGGSGKFPARRFRCRGHGLRNCWSVVAVPVEAKNPLLFRNKYEGEILTPCQLFG
jgi:hypothetical protein